ncbi:MAG: tetratricopeptide repeat protein [Bacteriovoracaceae bacterium]|nr:tetratricopeptide repeat protein [Bacteriovoracaceae bacterium]
MKLKLFWIILILTIISLTSVMVHAVSNDSRRQQLISVIDDELREVTRLNKRTRGRKPLLFLRMAELLLEKARLVKEGENNKYMAMSADKRRRANKKNHFKNSRGYFKQAQKVCYHIFKKFPHIKQKAEVYYILGSNAAEFQDFKRAKKYYKMAIKGSTRNRNLMLRTKLALAEMHYNDGEFRQAISLYEDALKKHRDKWWTKDAYNLAWSYFKERKYNKAISRMKQVYKMSKGARFVDVSERARRDLSYFSAMAGKPQTVGPPQTGEELVKVAKYLLSYGKYLQARKTFISALNKLTSDKDKVEVHVNLLQLYERSRSYQKHLQTSQTLAGYYRKNILNDEQKEIYKLQLKKMASILQNQVVGKTYLHEKKKRTRKTRQAVGYFDVLTGVDHKNAYMYHFAAAETLYAVGNFNHAIDYYDRAYELSKVARNKKIEKEAQKGLIVCIQQKGVSSAKKRKYTVQVYNDYLKNHPRSQRASAIYQRLFLEYMRKNLVDKAEDVLVRFKRYFPREHQKQETMLAKIMDYYKKRQDKANFSKWVKKIKRREFIVNPKYAKQLGRILLAMQFESVQGFVTKGDKKKALRAYVDIYKDPETSTAARRNATYNIMLLFHELRDARRTVGWAKRALKLMNPKEILRFETSFLTIAAELFSRRKFEDSVLIYEKTLKKLCNTKSKNKKTFFKNAYVIHLSEKKVEEAKYLIQQTANCHIPENVVNEARLEILKSLKELGRWNSVENQIAKLEKKRRMWPELIGPIYHLKNALERNGKFDLARGMKSKIMRFYKYSRKRKMKIPLSGLDVVAHYKVQELGVVVQEFNKLKLAFPEKNYNSLLKKKFAKLDRLTAKALEILSVGSGKGLVRVYKVLIESYESIVREMREFTPPGKGPEYTKSFRKSMIQISLPILKKVGEFKSEAKRQISGNNILSNENYLFMSSAKLPIKIEYQYSPGAVLMDRGGRR